MHPTREACPRCHQMRTLHFETDGMGGLVDVTPPCPCQDRAQTEQVERSWSDEVDVARRRACICQRCERPTVGRPKVALYCDEHRKEARAQAQRKMYEKRGGEYQARYRKRHRKKLNRKARQRLEDPEVRKRANDYKRQWRAQNRAKVKLQKRRSALRGRTAERMRRYRERVAAGEHTPTRTRWSEDGRRLCLTDGCPSVMEGRAKLCRACKEARAAA